MPSTLPVTIRAKKSHLNQRRKLLEMLGGKCVTCGFDNPKALQIDHINGGGRKLLFKRGPYTHYKFLLDNPKKAKKLVQLLCANCNWIKYYDNKEVYK